MAADTNGTARGLLAGALGFDRDQSAGHFLVHISAKLGFEELPVCDAVFPERTYWMLRL